LASPPFHFGRRHCCWARGFRDAVACRFGSAPRGDANLRITLISKGPDNAGYSKRTLALDQIETMAALAFERFAVTGHDRGNRGDHRLARSPGARRARGIARHRADALPFRDHRLDGRDVELALVLSDSTHADQRRASHTANDAGPLLLFRPRANSLLFDCSGIQIR
jgi:hypothetical protein